MFPLTCPSTRGLVFDPGRKAFGDCVGKPRAADSSRPEGDKPARLTRIDFRGGRAYPYKVKVREIVQMLKDDGWLLVRTRGSHHQYKHPTKPGLVTIPGNRNDELAPGTLNSILKQAGLKP